MAWIKSHPHLLVLILVAVGVLAASGMLVMNSLSFNQQFDSVRQNPPKGTKIYEQEQEAIEAAKNEFLSPVVWKMPAQHYSLFKSELYLVDKDGKLIPPEIGNVNTDSLTGEGIPNKWFLDNRLSPFVKGVSRQDPDNDGFPNEDEWRNKTDPNNKDSHPPYHTKLFLTQYIRVPFLIKFQAIDGDPEKDKPEDLKFQINMLSTRQRTQFLAIGETVPNTKFKIEKFQYKPPVKDQNEVDHEASELTLIDTESGSTIVVVINQITDSPDSYAVFRYLHPNPPKDIKVRKLQQFILLPEKEQLYKLLDVAEGKAVIQTPSGEKVEIPKLPAGYP